LEWAFVGEGSLEGYIVYSSNQWHDNYRNNMYIPKNVRTVRFCLSSSLIYPLIPCVPYSLSPGTVQYLHTQARAPSNQTTEQMETAAAHYNPPILNCINDWLDNNKGESEGRKKSRMLDGETKYMVAGALEGC
jgi:hypothetical protein